MQVVYRLGYHESLQKPNRTDLVMLDFTQSVDAA